MTELVPSPVSSGVGREPLTSHQFKVGDRVRLNSLGRARNPRTPPAGLVVSVGSRKSGHGSVCVLLDGLTSPRRLHRSYLELEGSAGV